MRHLNRHGQAIIASLLVALILLLDAMVASPALHELIHHDADEPGHHCAVGLFAHGKVESASIEVPVAAATVPIATTLLAVVSFSASTIENLPAGRAPPVLSASS